MRLTDQELERKPVDVLGVMLLLVTMDELGLVWDALMAKRMSMDVGDPEHAEVVRLLERVGDLMSTRFLAR